ncbi:hypothetical protein RIF29_34264 [Crotalaria pallida]|uniref:Uncharacterized protein n=1 Tax=Crotalaria pallida TaxID=3830 RepID=A0AAN9HTA0_CROPI
MGKEGATNQEKENPFGPWMLVKRPIRKKERIMQNNNKYSGLNTKGVNGSRFDALNWKEETESHNDVIMMKDVDGEKGSTIENVISSSVAPSLDVSNKSHAKAKIPKSSKNNQLRIGKAEQAHFSRVKAMGLNDTNSKAAGLNGPSQKIGPISQRKKEPVEDSSSLYSDEKITEQREKDRRRWMLRV